MANFPGEPSINTMKHQIQNVIDSYHNDYDVLSELLQNAVDAIEKRREIDSKFTGKIEIQINSDFKEIVVIDNGIGMSKDMLDRAVQVNESGKIDDPKTIGEKGVGLSFTIFNSGYAEIISTDDKETTRIVATNANLWLRSADEVAFKMPPESLPKLNQRGTKVMLSAINTDDSSFFDLNAAQLEFVIRTRTAIGNVNAIFSENFREIDVFLSYHNSTKAINVEEKKISNSYYLLDDVSKANIIGIDEGADVKIMDRLFWHREVPHSENFSKPGFQLKTA